MAETFCDESRPRHSRSVPIPDFGWCWFDN